MSLLSSALATKISLLIEEQKEKDLLACKEHIFADAEFPDVLNGLADDLRDFWERKLLESGLVSSVEEVSEIEEKLKEEKEKAKSEDRFIDLNSLPTKERLIAAHENIMEKLESAADLADFYNFLEQYEMFAKREMVLEPSELEYEVVKSFKKDNYIGPETKVEFRIKEGDDVQKMSLEQYEKWLEDRRRFRRNQKESPPNEINYY